MPAITCIGSVIISSHLPPFTHIFNAVGAENFKVTSRHHPRLEFSRFYSYEIMKRRVLGGKHRANLPLQAIYKLPASAPTISI
jgi:hypothetical protein